MPVLGTKLHIPTPRRQLVPRPRLLGQFRIDRTSSPRLILVCAPAGFGKTTLLTQWLADVATADHHPSRDDARARLSVAWLSLDAGDADLRQFLTHLIASVQITAPDVGADALAMLDSDRGPATEEVLVGLVNDLDAYAGPMVLALDDYHVIDTSAVHDAVAFLLDHLPPRVTVAVTARADPPLPLSRLRARGELLELRAADLRFTRAEAETFLNQVMGLALEPTLVAALEARTEGWAAGLQLAALSARGHTNATDHPAAGVEGFVEAFSGSQRFVLDYLLEEVLDAQPQEVRAFLLNTSVLEQLTGSLCDAVTGGNDGQRMLETLERDNLFLIPLDDHRQWYRYHHLFADALRARLLAEQPDRLFGLHRAASRWYTDQGLLAEAIAHANAAGDAEAAADLIERALPEARRQRHDRVIRDWLQALPDDVVRQRPVLSTQQAWMRLVEGDLGGVEASLRHAAQALETMSPAQGTASGDDQLRTLPAWIAIYRASAAQARGDADATAEYARRALELAGPEDHFARGGAAGFLGLAAWADGDLEVAVNIFTQAVTSLRAAGNVTDELGCTVVLAEMWQSRGLPAKARRLYEQALETAETHPGVPLSTTGDLHVGLADVLREQGELDAAERHLEAGQTLGEAASLPENQHRWHLARAGLLRARGHLDGALSELRQASSLYLPGFFPDVRPIPAAIARLQITLGHLEEAWDWAREHQVTAVDDLTYLAEFNHLTFARLLIAQHRSDGKAGSLEDAVGLLDRLLASAQAAGRGGSVVDAHLLLALAQDARGQQGAALAQLDRALAGAVPAGYVRLILDEGAPMEDLLQAARRRPGTGELAQAVLEAGATPALAVAPRVDATPPSEGLSDREVEVLRLLATDLTGPEIAGQLFMSVNTFRTHTRHIFTKLDVKTRRTAVQRGTDLGLL